MMRKRSEGSLETPRALAIGALLAACLAPPASWAVSVHDWTASTAAEFARGTLDGVAIDERGRLGLAPEIESPFGPEEGIVWDVAPAGERAAFVALSGPGRLLRVRRGAAPEVWFEAGEESLFTAVATDGQGGVFVGSSPDGTVRHLSAAGRVTAEAETGAKFVWSLDADPAGGVWIGTGVPGAVQRWVPGADVQTVFDAGDDPVRSVLALAPGRLVAGTGGRGRVIRLADTGDAFVLYDAEEKEVVDLAVNDAGLVFALTAGGVVQPPRAPTDVERTPDNSVSVTATPPPGPAASTPPAESDKPAGKPAAAAGLTAPTGGALYRIDPDGDTRKIWSTTSEIPFATVILPDGRLLVATGDKGKVYRLDADGRSSSLLRIPSNQASAMTVGDGGEIIVGGSSDARLSLVGPGVAERGDYVSAAIDAGTVADWGRIRWDGELPRGAAVEAAIRVGNTEEPDATWTEWMPLADGVAGKDIQTSAPPGRWMQIRLSLSQRRGALPTVSRLEAFFTPRNRPPLVQNLTIAPAGVVWVKGPENNGGLQGPFVADDPVARRAASSLRRPGQATAPIRRMYEQGARTFSWQGADPDDDRLTYVVEIRRDDASSWFPLAEDLEDEFFSWDGRSLPDGLYRVRVTAVDQRDNPQDRALSHSDTSEAFPIDNTRPRLDGPRVTRDGSATEVEFLASDPAGRVASVEIALDGGDWQPLAPADGVADSEEERYRLRIPPGTTAAARYLRVRVADAVGNLGGDAWLIEP